MVKAKKLWTDRLLGTGRCWKIWSVEEKNWRKRTSWWTRESEIHTQFTI